MILKAPWTKEQVFSLNFYQRRGNFHPYTCGTDGCKSDNGIKSNLIATEQGWICKNCDYTQNWAHDFTAVPLTEADFEELLKEKERLEKQLDTMREAIEEHKSKTGHHLCWQNDLELWKKTIDPHAEYPHETIPDPVEMEKQCKIYIRSRLEGLPYIEPEVKKFAVTKEGNSLKDETKN